MEPFLGGNFLLQTETARRLYHQHAAKMPIYDFHCHLPPAEIAQDRRYTNISEIWLHGDHYKWRAMRTNGIPEDRITGEVGDREKFQAWAETVPKTIGNPLYHWTHMELKTFFGIDNAVLNPDTAEQIWQQTCEALQRPEFSVRSLLERMQVKLVCTTDDPADDLAQHRAVAKDRSFHTAVVPGFRPDKSLQIGAGSVFRPYLERLGNASGIEISGLTSLKDALSKRLEYFHQAGCRISDHALTEPVAAAAGDREVEAIVKKVLNGTELTPLEVDQYTTHMLVYLGREYRRHNWTMQLHIGALRNNNTRMFHRVGPDSGFDSMADGRVAAPLARFMDMLDHTDELPRTVIYNLNPRDNDLVASLVGCFQDGSVPGKVQFGSGWWFNDQKDGMTRQMLALANIGLLSRFIGMLTDSRSFLSFPRHEYFRRLLCDIIGSWVEAGEAPNDMRLLGEMVEDICWHNAKNYFAIELPQD